MTIDTIDWPTISVMVALGGLLWRQLAALGARVDALDVRLTGAVEGLAGRVGDVDRRLARLEGRIEGERAGRRLRPSRGEEGT